MLDTSVVSIKLVKFTREWIGICYIHLVSCCCCCFHNSSGEVCYKL